MEDCIVVVISSSTSSSSAFFSFSSALFIGKQETISQWGRGLSTPEISFQQHPRLDTPLLQWGRGLSTPEISAANGGEAAVRRASMGPGSFDPGNGRRTGFVDARPARLQWGRGLSTPEMGCPVSKDVVEPFGFNGAGVFRPRK